MKRIIHRFLTTSLLVMILLLGLASFAYATPEFYLGVSQVYNSISTKETEYRSDNEILVVPDLRPGNGLSVTWGMEFHRCALEFGLAASSHDGDYGIKKYDTSYGIFDANCKIFIGSSQYVKPYFLVGLCVTELVVEDGAYNDLYDESGDATYTGAGLNLGWGMEVKFSNVGLKGEVIYRSVEYTEGSGVEDSGTLEQSFDGNGLTVNAGINFYF